MKLTFLFLLTGLIAVSASTYSQNTRINVEVKNNSIIELFKEIEANSEFYFFYQKEELADLENISVNKKSAKVTEILDEVLEGTSLEYKIVDRYIIIRKDGLGLEDVESITSQQNSITGTVTDEGGEPLPGVTVIIKGTTNGTVTNMDGKYSISNVPEDATLQFSFVGMLTQEVVVGSQSTINVTMAADAIGIEEVVAVGYATQKKINLTGSVDVVTAEQIELRPVTNVTEALQGASPGLIVSSSYGSNEPGGSMSLNIRGVGSLTGDDSPYVLVDGIPMDINDINPNDIASISVLKDAAASAIYGARATYGVVLVTTKIGFMEDKITVEYSNNISWSSPLGMPHMVNSIDYMTAHNQAMINAGQSPDWTDFHFDRARQYQAGEIEEESWALENGNWAGGVGYDRNGNANNDWLYIYYNDFTMRQKHDVNVRGGTKKSSYYMSAGFFDQPSELAYGDMYYKKYNMTANISTKPADWISLGTNFKYLRDEKQFFATTNGFHKQIGFHNFARRASIYPMVLPNGEYANRSHLQQMTSDSKQNVYGSNLVLNLNMTLEPVKDWVTTVNYNYQNTDSRDNQNAGTVWGTKPDGTKYVQLWGVSSYHSTFSDNASQMFNIVSSYNKTINEHYFSLLGGFESIENEFNGLYGTKKNILVPDVPSISTATGDVNADDTKWHWSTMGYFGRFNYNYKEKYLFETNFRYDGSSRFQEGSRWGFFPSVSLGYNISKENFWQTIEPYVNSLKIRGSWGSLGNHNVPNYLYMSTLGIGTQLHWIEGSARPNYTTAPGLVSADLTWETSTTTNVGMDISFLDSRLSSTIDVFSRETSDMFGPSEALPAALGTAVPLTNNATLETRGFEFTLSWKDRIGDDFSYNIKAYLADNVTTIKEYNNPTNTLSTWYEGKELGEIWGLTTVGIYQSDAEAQNGPDQSLFWPTWGAGDIQYKDLDGDEEITRGDGTADNPGDYSIIGNATPRYSYALSSGFEWKGFDFNMLWQGVLKKDYAFKSNDQMFYGFNAQQWWDMNAWEQGDDTTIDYWRPADETNSLGPNVDAYYPKPYLAVEDIKNKQIQTRYMQSAAYLRLKNLTIGYTLPENVIGKIKFLSSARIYVSGENLLTFTSLTKLFDPEIISTGGLSLQQGVSTGGYGGQVAKGHFGRSVLSTGISVKF